MKKSILTEVLTSLLILLFLYASISKYIDFAAFKRSMHHQPFPFWLSTIFIWTVPPIEISIAVLLIVPFTRLAGLYASLVLMSLFTFYIAGILLHFFPYVPCSCGGVISRLSWGQHLVFNVFFLLVAYLSILLTTGRFPVFRKENLHPTKPSSTAV